jgi:hypothetical protein
MTDLLHRIRWVNVARAGALLLAILLALAWPRLKAHDDGLPPALAEPAAVADEDGTTGGQGAAADEHDTATGHLTPAPSDAATRRKAATRRAAKAATAKRAQQRRRTVARRRRAAATTADRTAAHTKAAPGGAASGGAALPPYRPAAPASPAAEFRP